VSDKGELSIPRSTSLRLRTSVTRNVVQLEGACDGVGNTLLPNHFKGGRVEQTNSTTIQFGA